MSSLRSRSGDIRIGPVNAELEARRLGQHRQHHHVRQHGDRQRRDQPLALQALRRFIGRVSKSL